MMNDKRFLTLFHINILNSFCSLSFIIHYSSSIKMRENSQIYSTFVCVNHFNHENSNSNAQ